MTHVRRILVPVDFTEPSNRAVDVAVTMARRFHARILLIHVIEQFTYSVTDTVQVVDHYAALKAIAGPMMDSLRQRLRRKGIKAEAKLGRGNAAKEIVEQARKSRADLVIMGSHGRTGVPLLLLGSVAERVVRLAPCSVLTVKGPPVGRRKRRR